MAKSEEHANANHPGDLETLRTEIANLKDHLRALTDTLEQIREYLQWLTRNPLPPQEPPRTVPVLKQMAADPCADAAEWNDRLVIARSDLDTQQKPSAADDADKAAESNSALLTAPPRCRFP